MFNDSLDKYRKEVMVRTDGLLKHGYLIEVFLLDATALEQVAGRIVDSMETFIHEVMKDECGSILHLKKLERQEMTMGAWKKYLIAYGVDEDIVKRYGEVVDFRNECVHEMLNKDVSISVLEKRAEEMINKQQYLILEMMGIINSILTKQNEYTKKYLRGK